VTSGQDLLLYRTLDLPSDPHSAPEIARRSPSRRYFEDKLGHRRGVYYAGIESPRSLRRRSAMLKSKSWHGPRRPEEGALRRCHKQFCRRRRRAGGSQLTDENHTQSRTRPSPIWARPSNTAHRHGRSRRALLLLCWGCICSTPGAEARAASTPRWRPCASRPSASTIQEMMRQPPTPDLKQAEF